MTTDLYIVRLWDGFDGEWMDVSEPLPKDEADKLCTGSYNDIDYYMVFTADTKMFFADGNSQTRR